MLRIRTTYRENALVIPAILVYEGRVLHWSLDQGANFAAKTVPSSNAKDADISKDGSYIIVSDGAVKVSTNGGTSFNSKDSSYCVTCCLNEDGQHMAYLYAYYNSPTHQYSRTKYSNNYGTSFSSNAMPSVVFDKMLMSKDGGKIIGTKFRKSSSSNAHLILSTNHGVSWQDLTNSGTNIVDFDIDDYAQTILLIDYSGNMKLSTNGGSSFSNIKSVIRTAKCAVANQNVMYYGSEYDLYKSTDGGTIWNKVYIFDTSASISNIACSSDGRVVAVQPTSKEMYLSTDGGATFSNVLTTTNMITGIKIKG